MCNVFGAELVVVGGGFGVAGFDWIEPAALETAKRDALDAAGENLRIVRAELGTMAGLIGAGLLAFDARLMLSVCATPIGNLEDVTLRVLRELREADVDPLRGHAPHAGAARAGTASAARSLSYHEHNEAKRTAELLPRLVAGERVALVSDAGMPGISDPGARLIVAALEAGVTVTVLPGPSAVETALVASGLVGERYQFVGYLPRGEKALATLWDELSRWPWPVVAFESPQRLPRTLRSLATAMPARRAAVCRELTKAFEEVARGTAEELADEVRRAAEGRDRARPRSVRSGRGRAAGVDAVVELVGAGVPRRQAAAVVARLTGASRNALFEASL